MLSRDFVLHESENETLLATEAGSHALSLRQLAKVGLRVPTWFAVGASALQRFVKGNALEDFLHSADQLKPEAFARECEKRLLGCSVSPEIARSLEQALTALGLRKTPLLLRASHCGRDLNHPVLPLLQNGKVEVLIALRRAWASAFRTDAIREIEGACWPAPVSVVIQKFYTATSSGAVHSNRQGEIVIHAAWGHRGAEAKVHDVFTLDRELRHSNAQIAEKKQGFHPTDEGVFHLRSSGAFDASRASLTSEQALEIAHAALKFEASHQGRPQTLEWIIGDAGLFFLGAETSKTAAPIKTAKVG